ncbi:MAG: hypothetical protein HYT42_01045 [Candidatus Sungbacteria bacterium]|nr:hypothetical protein [Candidatus Sungbacteria bacterium]
MDEERPKLPKAVVEKSIGYLLAGLGFVAAFARLHLVKPHKRKRLMLGALVRRITPENMHEELQWGRPVDKEVW